MYPISTTVKALFDAEQRQTLLITGTDKNGVAINITEADVMMDGFNIDRYCCNSNHIEVGTAIASEMTLKLNNRDGSFNNVVFEGTELYVRIGIADWSLANPTIYYVPCGYFTCYEQPRGVDVITIHALDRMTWLDITTPPLTPWTTGSLNSGQKITDGNGNVIDFCAELEFPTKVRDLYTQICLRLQLEYTSVFYFPNSTQQIDALPQTTESITWRTLIQWCAGIMGANAYISQNGTMSVKANNYDSSRVFTYTDENRFKSDIQENDIEITGFAFTNSQNYTVVAGNRDYVIDLTGNALAENNIAPILSNLNNSEAWSGFTYRPFTASIINAPYLFPMDIVYIEDRNGNSHKSFLTNVNFGINCPTVIESRGETTQANSAAKLSSFTPTQAQIIDGAIQRTDNLDKSLDQEGIFNRLTNNGAAQGIYMIDGQLYVNMTYARSGTLVLGGLNNQNGLLRIMNAINAEIGSWDDDGIHIGKGIIDIGGDEEGFHISSDGNLAMGEKPDDMGSFANNNCRFQIFKTGQVKSVSLDIYEDTGSTYYGSIYAINDPTLGTGIRINSTGYQLYVCNGGIAAHGLLKVNGDFTVTGTKSREVDTDQYSGRLLYCYETPSPMFGDVGEGVIGEDGKCYVWLDAVFAQTVNTSQYQVFLQKYGEGECYVSERNPNYFVVVGEPGLAFGWEIKARQNGYDLTRMESSALPFNIPAQTYGEDAVEYINTLHRGRMAA